MTNPELFDLMPQLLCNIELIQICRDMTALFRQWSLDCLQVKLKHLWGFPVFCLG
jgi:hypothetical protein